MTAKSEEKTVKKQIIVTAKTIDEAVAKGVLKYFGIDYQTDSPENIAYLKSRYNGILNG